MKPRYAAAAALLAALLLPGAGEAQKHRGWRKPNPWTFSPYAGLFKDGYDVSADGDNTGWTAGFRIGYALGDRSRLTANVAYAESDDVVFNPTTGPYYDYDNQYIVTTGGAEYDIIPGNTAVALGVEAGGLWRKVVAEDYVGDLPGESLESGYTFYFAVAPAVSMRHGFSPRTAFEVSVRDFILPEDEVEHFPMLTVGFRFR